MPNTFGCITSGSATTASIADFQRTRLCASHHASGVPSTSRVNVVTPASCAVSESDERRAAVSMGTVYTECVGWKSGHATMRKTKKTFRALAFALHRACVIRAHDDRDARCVIDAA